MELNHLKYFYTVAKEGSFTRASKVLKIQQPTVSKMVQSLESQLGVALLDRHKKGIRVTKHGGEIFRACEEIFDRIEGIRTLSARESLECEGRLALGVPASVASYLIPPVLRRFVKDSPKAQISIWTGTAKLISQEIMEGSIEFGIFFAVSEESDFQVTELLPVPFHVVISTKHLRRSEVRSSFILARMSDYPQTSPFPIMEMLKRNKLQFKTTISSNNLDSQKQLVREGLGVALLPEFMIKKDVESGALTILYPSKEFSYTLKLVTRKGKILSRGAATFISIFKEQVAGMVEKC